MNRYSCKVIQDLLPLYLDDCCSGESRQIVATHLEECWECRQSMVEMQQPFSPTAFPEEHVPANILKRGMRKLRKLFFTGLSIAVALLILTAVVLGVKEIRSWLGYEKVELNFQSNCYFIKQGYQEDDVITGQSTFSIVGTGKSKLNSKEAETFFGYAEVAAYPIPMEIGSGWYSCHISKNMITISNQSLRLVNPEAQTHYTIMILRSDPSICMISIWLEDGSAVSAICGENETDALENYQKFWAEFPG